MSSQSTRNNNTTNGFPTLGKSPRAALHLTIPGEQEADDDDHDVQLQACGTLIMPRPSPKGAPVTSAPTHIGPSALTVDPDAPSLFSTSSPSPSPTGSPSATQTVPLVQIAENEVHSETKIDPKRKPVQIADFELMCVVGRGAYGKVFQVRRKRSGKVYAMKVLKKNKITTAKDATQTRSERDVLEVVKSPFIVNLCFAFQTDQKLYFILDYIPGGELFSRIDEAQSLSEEETRFYAAEVVVALEHLHSLNIMYRDLKPENILLTADGHICLTDFGFAKPEMSDSDRTNTFCGTIQYMAPELIQKTGHGRAADWWALGAMMYEMMTGRTPFHGDNRKKIQQNILTKKVTFPPHFSMELRSLLKGLLSRDVKSRLGSKGVEDIKAHRFFQGINWTHVAERKLVPPHVPKIAHNTDTARYDAKFTSEQPIDSPSSMPGDDVAQLHADLFRNFSYNCSPTSAYGSPNHKGALPPLPLSDQHNNPEALVGHESVGFAVTLFAAPPAVADGEGQDGGGGVGGMMDMKQLAALTVGMSGDVCTDTQGLGADDRRPQSSSSSSASSSTAADELPVIPKRLPQDESAVLSCTTWADVNVQHQLEEVAAELANTTLSLPQGSPDPGHAVLKRGTVGGSGSRTWGERSEEAEPGEAEDGSYDDDDQQQQQPEEEEELMMMVSGPSCHDEEDTDGHSSTTPVVDYEADMQRGEAASAATEAPQEEQPRRHRYQAQPASAPRPQPPDSDEWQAVENTSTRRSRRRQQRQQLSQVFAESQCSLSSNDSPVVGRCTALFNHKIPAAPSPGVSKVCEAELACTPEHLVRMRDQDGGCVTPPAHSSPSTAPRTILQTLQRENAYFRRVSIQQNSAIKLPPPPSSVSPRSALSSSSSDSFDTPESSGSPSAVSPPLPIGGQKRPHAPPIAWGAAAQARAATLQSQSQQQQQAPVGAAARQPAARPQQATGFSYASIARAQPAPSAAPAAAPAAAAASGAKTTSGFKLNANARPWMPS